MNDIYSCAKGEEGALTKKKNEESKKRSGSTHTLIDRPIRLPRNALPLREVRCGKKNAREGEGVNTVLEALRYGLPYYDASLSMNFFQINFYLNVSRCTVYSVGARCLLCWGVFGLFSMKLKKKVLNVSGYSISLRITV